MAGFVGTPPMNLLDATVVDEGGELDFGEFKMRLPTIAGGLRGRAGRTVTVGVRPADVVPDPSGPEFSVEAVEPLESVRVAYVRRGALGLAAVLSTPNLFPAASTLPPCS